MTTKSSAPEAQVAEVGLVAFATSYINVVGGSGAAKAKVALADWNKFKEAGK